MYEIEYFPDEENALLLDLIQTIKKYNDSNGYQEIKKYIENLEKYGLDMNEKFKFESYKYLKNGLYELRPNNYRIFFTKIKKEDKFIILHGFRKSSQKTPKKEIRRARKYVSVINNKEVDKK